MHYLYRPHFDVEKASTWNVSWWPTCCLCHLLPFSKGDSFVHWLQQVTVGSLLTAQSLSSTPFSLPATFSPSSVPLSISPSSEPNLSESRISASFPLGSIALNLEINRKRTLKKRQGAWLFGGTARRPLCLEMIIEEEEEEVVRSGKTPQRWTRSHRCV